MQQWQKAGAAGISIGGQWYAADSNGIVSIPDAITGLEYYGFVKVAAALPTYSSGFIKIALIGDSMSAQNQAWGMNWLSHMEYMMRQNGIRCEARSFAINGATFYTLNNTAVFGSKTQVQACIDYAPDIVLVVCGVNDTVNGPSRTLVQAKADADTTFTALRAGLPIAQIWYGEQQPYDTTNFTSSTVKNKGLPPLLMNKRTTGLLTGAFHPAILDDAASSTTKTELANYDSLNTYIKAKTVLAGTFAMRAWKIARTGVLINDGYHMNQVGDILKACAALSTLRAAGASWLQNISDQNVAGWSNIDTFLSGFLTQSGDGWVTNWPTVWNGSGTTSAIRAALKPSSWFYEYKATANFYPLALTNTQTITGQYRWYIDDAQPLSTVYNAIQDHATQGVNFSTGFIPSGLTTDQNGYAEALGLIGALSLPNGTYDFFLKVGNDAFGPYVITLS